MEIKNIGNASTSMERSAKPEFLQSSIVLKFLKRKNDLICDSKPGLIEANFAVNLLEPQLRSSRKYRTDINRGIE